MSKPDRTGQLVPMIWDDVSEDGLPPAYYVYGHVSDETFRKAVPVTVPPDAKIEHVYVRVVPSAPECDFRHEIRHCSKGRGASPRTVWSREPTRADGY